MIMDSPLLSSLVLSLGILFSFSALLVQSEENKVPVSPLLPPPVSQPPPPPPHHHHLAPPPPHKKKSHRSNQPSKNTKWHRSGESHKRKKDNLGKKVGLWFIGVAAGLQVCVVGVLGIQETPIAQRARLFIVCLPLEYHISFGGVNCIWITRMIQIAGVYIMVVANVNW